MSTVASVLTYCSDMKVAHAVARVMDRVTLDQQQPLSMQVILWIVYAVVEYFYSCLLYDGKLYDTDSYIIDNIITYIRQDFSCLFYGDLFHL